MIKNKAERFYPYFDLNERPTVDRFVGLFNRVYFQNRPYLTDFLNPREYIIWKTICGTTLSYNRFGGYPSSEKNRLLINGKPDSLNRVFQIVCFELEYSQRFNRLTHQQILGTLMHLGVDTSTFGDLITDGAGRWQFFVKKDLAPFFNLQMTRVGHMTVKLKTVSFHDVLNPIDNSQLVKVHCSSLRLDAIISAVSKMSRHQVDQALEHGFVQQNFHVVTKADMAVVIQDVLSLRHFGRFQLLEVMPAKKGKYWLKLKLWASHH